MFTYFSFAQNTSQIVLIVGPHFGLNTNAYTDDAVAKPFLDEGFGLNKGIDISFNLYTKKNRIFQFSYSHSFLNHSISPSNLMYEFGYDYDNDCCLRIGSGQLMTTGVGYLFRLYDVRKVKVLSGLGISLNLDMSTSSGGINIQGRDFWSEVNTKTNSIVFPSYNFSTQIIYNLTKKYLITANLSFVQAPFSDLDFEYTISSKDGIYNGLFHQKLSSLNVGIGLGVKL